MDHDTDPMEEELQWIVDLLRQAAYEPPPLERDRVIMMLRELGYTIPSDAERRKGTQLDVLE